MPGVEITFERGLRIWWSFTWRTLVLLLPVLVLASMFGVPAFYSPTPPDGAGAAVDPMAESSANPFMFVVLLAVNLILQVQALRWMLRTRWREFHLEAVANDSTPQPRAPRQEGEQ